MVTFTNEIIPGMVNGKQPQKLRVIKCISLNYSQIV